MNRLIRLCELKNILAASNRYVVKERGKHAGVKAKILNPSQYEAKKNRLHYQGNDRKYNYYTKLGNEQYTWDWYAVLIRKEDSDESVGRNTLVKRYK